MVRRAKVVVRPYLVPLKTDHPGVVLVMGDLLWPCHVIMCVLKYSVPTCISEFGEIQKFQQAGYSRQVNCIFVKGSRPNHHFNIISKTDIAVFFYVKVQYLVYQSAILLIELRNFSKLKGRCPIHLLSVYTCMVY